VGWRRRSALSEYAAERIADLAHHESEAREHDLFVDARIHQDPSWHGIPTLPYRSKRTYRVVRKHRFVTPQNIEAERERISKWLENGTS